MPTLRLLPTTYYLSSTSYLAITDPNNIYTNTDSTNYATVQNKQTGTTSYYIYIRGFDFSAVPDDAIINSFSIKFKAKESGISTSTSYRPYLCNNTTTITGDCGVVNTNEQVLTFTDVTATWEQIVDYGANFGIRINCRRNSRNTTGYMYIYGAEIVVDYSLPIRYNISTSATGCSIIPNGNTTVTDGEPFFVRIESAVSPKITDNGIDVSNQLVEKQPTLEYEVATASGASYGFVVNSNGYYESQNKGKASSASVCKVNLNLPVECTVTFHLINYGESRYDYGLLSEIDKTLTNSASADSQTAGSANVYWSGYSNASSSVQDVNYTVPVGNHFIYAKYFKDSYTDSNNDSLQFKIDITPNEDLPDDTFFIYELSAVHEDHIIIATIGASDPILYIVENGQLVEIKEVYKVVNNTLVIVSASDIENNFDTSKNYLRG